MARLPPCSSAIFCNACRCLSALASLTSPASCCTDEPLVRGGRGASWRRRRRHGRGRRRGGWWRHRGWLLHDSRPAGRGGENDRDPGECESDTRDFEAVDILTNPGARCEVPDSAAGECWSVCVLRLARTAGTRSATKARRSVHAGPRTTAVARILVVGPASVEAVDVVAVDDQFVAG